ncbi:MAG: MFS transporter [Hyphococcus sp.]|nr:MAG: MFS transporter [Marinicaulis sp.]
MSDNKKKMRLIIAASTAGTAFEGYDYFIFGALATILSTKFFAGVDEGTAFIFALLTFAVGFVTRPLGAIVFGRLGDRLGRKQVFLVAIALMGGATVAIGLLPTYAQIGVFAPALLVFCRMVQGFALGGEYGGAIIYVAEHSSAKRRGFNTAWIQTTGAIGLISALSVILVTRKIMGEDAFQDWGWRIPFLLSFLLLVASIWLRLKLSESPVFEEMKARGGASRAPVRDSFLVWRNLKIILLALFGLVMATGVMFYSGQFFVQFFLERISKVPPATVNMLIVSSAVISAPLFVLFGALSDKVGRKPVMLGGMALMLVLYFPAFHVLANAANPALVKAEEASPIVVVAPPGDCSVQFDPMGRAEYTSSCDIAKQALGAAGVNYTVRIDEAALITSIEIKGTQALNSVLGDDGAPNKKDEFKVELRQALYAAGYPASADPDEINYPVIILVIVLFITSIAALSGPQAAALAELFPAHIRYTALSFPYHVGLGWFGGFMPAIAFAIIAKTGNTFSGLWYPFIITLVALLISLVFLPETRGRALDAAPD